MLITLFDFDVFMMMASVRWRDKERWFSAHFVLWCVRVCRYACTGPVCGMRCVFVACAVCSGLLCVVLVVSLFQSKVSFGPSFEAVDPEFDPRDSAHELPHSLQKDACFGPKN